MGEKSVEWRMACSVNGQSFEFNGAGYGNSESGDVRLDLTTTGFPAGFDPVSCPCICNAPVTIGFARNENGLDELWQVAGGRLSIAPARVGAIYNSRGDELLHLSVSSVIHVKGEAVVIGNQMQGFSHLPALAETLSPVDEFIIPTGAGSALSSLRFKLLTKTGEVLTGMTLVPYSWESDRCLEAPLARRYEYLNVTWDGASSVRTTVRSTLLPLKTQGFELPMVTSELAIAYA